jgi:hypothetical protein
LAGLWWLGAAFLVAGSVIIGRREEGKEVGAAGTAGAEPAVAVGAEQEPYRDEPDAPIAGVEGSVEDSFELVGKAGRRRSRERNEGREVE